MLRFGVLFLLLFLTGCGNSTFDNDGVSGGVVSPVSGRSQLAIFGGDDVVAAIDALPPNEAQLVYFESGQWSSGNVPLTGTAEDAYRGAAAIVRDSQFGARGLYEILARLQPDNGQGFVVTFGGTLNSGVDTARARALDSYSALLSQSNVVAQNVEPIISANLPPEISGMAEFHGLRILDPTYLPAAKRDAMLETRGLVPNAEIGEAIQKIIMVSDLESYLNGTFDPEVGGFTAIQDQTAFLVTPAQYIAGLRLDYVGGFQGQTQVGAMVFPQDDTFEMVVPFSPPMGGVTEQDYPFTGTGFTSNVQAQAVPEWIMPPGPRVPLPVGSQLFLVTENGDRQLQGTLNAQGMWTLNQQILSRHQPRQTVRRSADYQGHRIWVSSTDGEHYWVAYHGSEIPENLLIDQKQIGRGEHLGRLRVDDAELVFIDR